MYVPEPVISLAIKPAGQETPNFSRALNRFQKEDPTFKVHIDRESKEVCTVSFVVDLTSIVLLRPSSRAWESFISTSMLNA